MDPEFIRDAARRLGPIASQYTLRLRECGSSPRGVYWKTLEGQYLRFEVLLGVVDLRDDKGGITINDLGCGYGAFFDYLADRPVMRGSRFIGYDICDEMLLEAKARIKDARATFTQSMIATEVADYSFVSGSYNMKLDQHDRDWSAYVEGSLRQLWSMTRKGLAFNMLCRRTKNRKESDLYYADWQEFRDFCTQELSPQVTVMRNYPLDEWTIYVHR
ncbi:MAG: class I SAM-dependent methyltransferase [Rhodospirillales bacterium]|nr:class I SAM-dependent methyltransferase [Rhodospirillales bacterium]